MSRSRSDRSKHSAKLGYRRWRRRNAERSMPPRDQRKTDARPRGFERTESFVPMGGDGRSIRGKTARKRILRALRELRRSYPWIVEARSEEEVEQIRKVLLR